MLIYICSCCHKKFSMRYVSKRNLLCVNCGAPAFLINAELNRNEFEEHVRKYKLKDI